MHASSFATFANSLARLAAGAALLATVAACGYKGPLYMPPPPPDESLATPPSSMPAPASPESSGNSQPATTSPVKVQ